MTDTTPVRLDATLVAAAEAAGAVAGRSGAGQLTYWARLGRALETFGEPGAPIRTVLNQRAHFDTLSAEDQATLAALWDRLVAIRLDTLDMAAHHEAERTPYSALDDNGHVVTIQPPNPSSANPPSGDPDAP